MFFYIVLQFIKQKIKGKPLKIMQNMQYLRPSLPFYAMTCYDQLHTSLQRTGSWLPFQKSSFYLFGRQDSV